MVLVSQSKRTPPMHHKKRTGQHRKQDKHFHKTYWPYLPLVVMVAVGLAINSLWAHANSGVLGASTDLSANMLMQDTNAARANNRKGPLHINAQLAQAAQAKAEDMVKRNYWAHVTPDGMQPWKFITQTGYDYQVAGENLAYGFSSSNQTITAWLNSPEHRQNLLDNRYRQVGFGIAQAPDFQGNGPETIVVAEYATPAGVGGAPAPSQVLPAKSVARVQLLTGGSAPWSFLAVSLLTVGAVAIFILRHGLLWRKALVKSEALIINHHLLDVTLVAVGVLGFILTRTVGAIQ